MKTPPKRVLKAKAEVRGLLDAIMLLDLPQAATHIRSHPLSADAIAILAFYAHELFTSGQNSYNASHPHPHQMREQVRRLKREYGVRTFSELEKKHPEEARKVLRDFDYNKPRIAQLFSKAKLP